MEAKELRVGNLVKYDDSVYLHGGKITEIGDIIQRETDYYEPIPITEEWLLKIYQAKPESKLNLSFIFNSNCKMWVDKSNEKNHIWHYVWKGNYIQIKFLHHLQNIHYYLNNFEELTIKN
jgi:hypothetical protein